MPIPGSREDRRAEKKDDYFGSLISHTSTKHCWEGRDTEIITKLRLYVHPAILVFCPA